jgi:hypothetical protein
MRIPRRLSTLIALLLLLGVAAPGIAAQIEGETWTSPTYGFSVSWAGTDWQPDPDGTLTAVGPERLDRLHLTNGINSLYFEGATRYQGNLSSCVAQEANLLGQESGVSEIRPYRDEDGAPLVASGPNAEAAAFTLTLEVAGQEVELVDYVECRTLIPGEAVLIITLVADPASFKEQLASMTEISNTIVLAEQQPLDPLAAYGGWTAAATQQPSIAGPLSGNIPFGPGDLGVVRAGVDAPDVYARAEFHNPDSADVPLWDIGLGFRDSGDEEQFRLVVDSQGAWFFKDGLGPAIAGGTVADFDTSPDGANVMEIIAVGDTGYFAFNERLVSALDLSSRPDGGDLFVGAGFFTEDAASEGVVPYSGFEIWSLEGVDIETALAPQIAMDAATFSMLLAAATAEPPLAGPTAGDLEQTVGSATVVPADVDVEDFVARAAFVNPSAAADRPWDFGIAFREQPNGDHFRLTIASDGTWEFQIGLQAELSSGTVPSINFERDALNTLDLVVAGDTAGFAVNGDFVSDLDTSFLDGTGDVWIGAGFHQANVREGDITHYEQFTVWPLPPVAEAAAPAMATPVAGSQQAGGELALRLSERADSGVDALAVLRQEGDSTTIAVAARGAAGGEVAVIHDGTCAELSPLPSYFLDDLDAAGRSETEIDAPLADLADGAHAIALHRSTEDYEDILACGDIPGAG